jgi:hypothetical protein
MFYTQAPKSAINNSDDSDSDALSRWVRKPVKNSVPASRPARPQPVLAAESDDDGLTTRMRRPYSSQSRPQKSGIHTAESKNAAPSDSDDSRIGFGQPRDTPPRHPRTPGRPYGELEEYIDEEHDSDIIPLSEPADDSRAEVTQLLIPRNGKLHSPPEIYVLTHSLGGYTSQENSNNDEEDELETHDSDEGAESDNDDNGSHQGLIIQGAFGRRSPRAFSLPLSSPSKHHTRPRKPVAGQKRRRSPVNHTNVRLSEIDSAPY